MKLVYAIIDDSDKNSVTDELTKQHFSVSILNSTGGFLRKGNTTLLIGTEKEKIDEVIEILKKECGQRKKIVHNTPYLPVGCMGVNTYSTIPITVEAGGAIIFVVDVERYVKV